VVHALLEAQISPRSPEERKTDAEALRQAVADYSKRNNVSPT
jgi:hypothetical protein